MSFMIAQAVWPPIGPLDPYGDRRQGTCNPGSKTIHGSIMIDRFVNRIPPGLAGAPRASLTMPTVPASISSAPSTRRHQSIVKISPYSTTADVTSNSLVDNAHARTEDLRIRLQPLLQMCTPPHSTLRRAGLRRQRSRREPIRSLGLHEPSEQGAERAALSGPPESSGHPAEQARGWSAAVRIARTDRRPRGRRSCREPGS
jgi:hypothetical protein